MEADNHPSGNKDSYRLYKNVECKNSVKRFCEKFCPYFSTCPSLKSGTLTPIKILFLQLKKIDLVPHKV